MGRVISFVGQLLGSILSVGQRQHMATDILFDLLDSCSSKLPSIRIRSLHLIESILSHTKPRESFPSDLATTLTERLDDKDAKARKAAVTALSSLLPLLSSGSAQSAVASLIECLAVERTLAVRSAIVSSLPPASSTSILIERTLDVSSQVRSVAFVKLKGVCLSDLAPGLACSLILRGSRDEDSSVKTQAKALIAHWATGSSLASEEQGDAIEGFISFLLSSSQGLDSSSLVAIDIALKSLVDSSSLDCALKMRLMLSPAGPSGSRPSTLRKAAELAILSDQPLSISISPARAILWRFLCSNVRSLASSLSSQAAATTGAASASLSGQASSLNDLLESFMPESASLAFHVILGLAANAGSNSMSTWIGVEQLIQVVNAGYDWTDLPSRQAAAEAIDKLAFTSCPTQSWTSSLVELLLSIHGSNEGSTSPLALLALIQLVTMMADEWGINSSSLSGVRLEEEEARRLSQLLSLASHSFSLASLVHSSNDDKRKLESLMDISLASMGDLENDEIRHLAVRALSSAALVSSIKSSHIDAIVTLLISAFDSATADYGKRSKSSALTLTACDAASGLTGLVLCYGQEADRAAGTGERSIVKRLIDNCHSSLSLSKESDCLLLSCISECLAKILLHQELQAQMSIRVASIQQEDGKQQLPFHLDEASSQQALATLLLLSVHPNVLEELPRVVDVLTVTWQEFFTRSTLSNTLRLTQTALPAIRLASSVECGSGKSASNLAPLLVKKVVQLLDLSLRVISSRSTSDSPSSASASADGRGTLALEILLLLSQPSTEPYPGMRRPEVQKELAKMLLLLVPDKDEQRTIKAGLVLIERIIAKNEIDASALALISSKVKSAFEQVEEPGDTEVDIEEMLAMLSIRGVSDAAPIITRAVKKKDRMGRKAAAVVKKKSKVESEDDGEEESEGDDAEEEEDQLARKSTVKEGVDKVRVRPRSRLVAA